MSMLSPFRIAAMNHKLALPCLLSVVLLVMEMLTTMMNDNKESM